MNETTSTQTPAPRTAAAASRRPGVLRRTLAGVVAASAIAFGGAGMISPAEASAAGVKTQTYVVQTQTVQPQSSTTVAPRGKA